MVWIFERITKLYHIEPHVSIEQKQKKSIKKNIYIHISLLCLCIRSTLCNIFHVGIVLSRCFLFFHRISKNPLITWEYAGMNKNAPASVTLTELGLSRSSSRNWSQLYGHDLHFWFHQFAFLRRVYFGKEEKCGLICIKRDVGTRFSRGIIIKKNIRDRNWSTVLSIGIKRDYMFE